LTKRRSGLTGRFADEVIDGLRRERSTAVAEAVEAAIGGAATDGAPREAAAQFFAVCERAWLRWSRLALDAITTQTLGQATLESFNPASVRNCDEAALAALRCGVHRQLLNIASEALEVDSPWLMEAARQVHVSTEKALRIAARLRMPQAASINGLYPAISHAVDALLTAIAAGFVVDGPREVLETVDALLLAGAARSTDGDTPDADRAGEWQRLGEAVDRSW
jgi:hypothetical protein